MAQVSPWNFILPKWNIQSIKKKKISNQIIIITHTSSSAKDCPLSRRKYVNYSQIRCFPSSLVPRLNGPSETQLCQSNSLFACHFVACLSAMQLFCVRICNIRAEGERRGKEHHCENFRWFWPFYGVSGVFFVFASTIFCFSITLWKMNFSYCLLAETA